MLCSSKNTFFSNSEKLVVVALLVLLLTGSGVHIYKNVLSAGTEDFQAKSRLDAFENDIQAVIAKDRVKKKIPEKKGTERKRKTSIVKTISLDLNQATKEEFEQLPHIGPVIAQRIIDYRKDVGRFNSVDELVKVKGIGIKTLNKVSPYLKIVN
ncbi:MAG: helix-hairpin-helix domain-containing protein [candidate division KSB1 bacterium]|jgi:comEA protein|nr:helix-hairpin-helix domain-containing protein [candidate division KSB1 bacterium]